MAQACPPFYKLSFYHPNMNEDLEFQIKSNGDFVKH